MGSGYFGHPNMLGNERSSSSSGSSRKGGAKKGNSDKPKQPQRGLGVAQLEKIRLHNQMGSTSYQLPNSLPYSSQNLSQEDVRMQTAYSSSSSFSYSTPSSSSYGFPAAHQNYPMGYGNGDNYEGIANVRYGDSQATTATRWAPGNNTFLDYSQQYAQPSGMTRQLLDLQAEESCGKRKNKHGSESSSQNSGSTGGHQDLDLELRLSL